MDRLEGMALLIAAVDGGSLSAAGRRFGIPLPSVSRKISELEASLHARLLVRTTRRLTLTEAGATYVDAARRILDMVGDAERTAAGEFLTPRGELVVTAPVVFGRLHVLPVVNAFLAEMPDVNVRLLLSDRNADLIAEHVDLAVRIGHLPDSSMVAVRLGAVRSVVCGSPAFFAAHGLPVTPEELAALPAITFDGLGSGNSWRFAAANGKGEAALAMRPRLSVNMVEAALDAAVAGVGVVRLLSYQAARLVADGKLHIVLTDFEPAPLPVNLLNPAQGVLPLKSRSFRDFAAPRLRKVLADLGG